ncbi:hypothetical protein E4U45_005895, partial [Claviceps purpurea]
MCEAIVLWTFAPSAFVPEAFFGLHLRSPLSAPCLRLSPSSDPLVVPMSLTEEPKQLGAMAGKSASFLTIEDTPLDDEKNANTIAGSKRDASAAPDSAPSVKRSKRTSRAKTNVQIGASYPAGDS